MWLCTNLEPVANGADTSNYESCICIALLRPVFLIPYVAMNFMAALAIRILIANICTRWRLIIKRLSQDQGRTDFSKKSPRLTLEDR
jgi:hypothetical protein